ncbi:hypothetical protein [Niabella drilacis]|uniref:DUF2975 domain-containing protein n=1 Tax=Niabella drilacis (strain DSM 25811 / CCM 8410 / CCUG 62505 / LMG 26954 / E90) TaxID=1285928 RepID=A0A1G6PFG3_NIADE|nr:hypothetical protein [Niabella drilacis]SDC78741.1 hypothetical protein SAMN04487894_10416 [Niabella drilacis]
MSSTLKKGTYVLYLVCVIGIVLFIKATFILYDLAVSKTPLFYVTTPCAGLRKAVLTMAAISSVITGLACILLYRALYTIVKSAQWSGSSSRAIRGIALLLIAGTYGTSLAAYIGDTYLLHTTVGCPLFTDILFASRANGYALGKTLFVQGPLLGCLFFISLFLEYVYSIKQENESFI